MNLAEWTLAAGHDGIPFATHDACRGMVDVEFDGTVLDLVTAIEAHACPRAPRLDEGSPMVTCTLPRAFGDHYGTHRRTPLCVVPLVQSTDPDRP